MKAKKVPAHLEEYKAIPGIKPCLKCDRAFKTEDIARVRICSYCKSGRVSSIRVVETGEVSI